MAEYDLFDIIASTRSMRRLKADPVPDDVIYQILDAGVRAPSGHQYAELALSGGQRSRNKKAG